MGTINSPFTWIIGGMGIVIVIAVVILIVEKIKGGVLDEESYWDEDDIHFI